MASIQARRLPAMAVSYESMTAQYAGAGAVVPLDRWVADPEVGLSEEAQADFFPAVLSSNYYGDYDGQLLSFPFAKSVLMLYANHRVLRAAGIDGPPATWDAFLAQARTIKEKTGKPAYAISVDCSTISGMIFSMGGELLVDGRFQYDQPASIRAFTLLETLVKEGLAYQIQPRTFDDEVAFARDDVAFTIRTSAGSANMAVAMGGKNDDWSINRLPQADPEHPATILFGPNITLFRVGEAQEAVAWDFVRHFTSPPVMTQWALATGYLPIRKSVAEHPEIQAYWAAWPSNRAPYACLEFARTEPNIQGWQEIRGLVEQAETSVLAGLQSGEAAARALQASAQAVLDRVQRQGGAKK
jgi:multiple sugar transport system substrate-binding protein